MFKDLDTSYILALILFIGFAIILFIYSIPIYESLISNNVCVNVTSVEEFDYFYIYKNGTFSNDIVGFVNYTCTTQFICTFNKECSSASTYCYKEPLIKIKEYCNKKGDSR